MKSSGSIPFGQQMADAFVRSGAALAMVFICALTMSGAKAEAAGNGQTSDLAAIHSLWSTLDTSWNARDAEQFSELFAVDGNLVFVDRAEFLEGRAAIYRSFADRFPQFSPDLRHLTTLSGIRNIAPKVCSVDGKVEILRTGGDGPAIIRTFAIFAVMLQTETGWQIRELRAYLLPDADEHESA